MKKVKKSTFLAVFPQETQKPVSPKCDFLQKKDAFLRSKTWFLLFLLFWTVQNRQNPGPAGYPKNSYFCLASQACQAAQAAKTVKNRGPAGSRPGPSKTG